MCIFSQPIISVNDTQIFARVSSRGTQYLAYQMNYESLGENAMILPLPIRQPAREDSLRFIDLQNYTDLFADLARGFPYSRPSFSIGCSGHPPAPTAALNVFEVGNYIASFVPTFTDFARLDNRFRLPEQTWSRLPRYKDFGFAVFQLAAGSLRPHPMAFEFETAPNSIFFPTLHIHDGGIHDTEEFDHVLYLQHAGFDSRVYAYENADAPDKSTGLVRSKFTAANFCDVAKSSGLIDANLLVHRLIIRGDNPNRDTEIAAQGDPIHPTFNFRSLWSYTPWLVFAAVITWFFSRRARIKSKTTAKDIAEL
jgi:hypothetical protein